MSLHSLPAAPLKSYSQPSSRFNAQSILQISYMELLYEDARSEPRLRRLLGHFRIYENASRWCEENNKKSSVSYPDGERETTEEDKAAESQSHQNGACTQKATEMQRVQNVAELEAAVQSQHQHQHQHRQIFTVTTTEATKDSDENDESCSSEESGESDSSDDDEDGSIGQDSENPATDRIQFLTKALSFKDKNSSTGELSRYSSVKEEQDDDRTLWKQQPQVLTERESQRAFYEVWL